MGSTASPPVATRLVLVRHGEGRANVERVLAGLRGCTGLTERGRRQVAALGAHWAVRGFRPDVLLCSPVRRARESADILAAALHVVVREECALCELHLGEADGLALAAYEAHYGRAFDLLAEPDRPCAPGAESWAAVMQRVRRCLDDLATAHAGQTVAIVTHAGFVVASLLELLAIPATGERAYLDPAFTSLTCWQHQAGRWTLVSFNDAHHLDGSSEDLPSRP
jgi:probable phosphoglycerate mutase